jgi:hypothetical protein
MVRYSRLPFSQHAGGHTGCHDIGSDVTGNNRSGADLRSPPNGNARQNDAPNADIGVVFNRHRRRFDGRKEDRYAAANFLVARGNNPNRGPNPNPAPNRQPAGAMKKALLAYPGFISDGHGIAIIALQDRLMADVDVVAQPNIFGMKNHHPPLKHTPLAATSELVLAKLAGAMALMTHGLHFSIFAAARNQLKQLSHRS